MASPSPLASFVQSSSFSPSPFLTSPPLAPQSPISPPLHRYSSSSSSDFLANQLRSTPPPSASSSPSMILSSSYSSFPSSLLSSSSSSSSSVAELFRVSLPCIKARDPPHPSLSAAPLPAFTTGADCPSNCPNHHLSVVSSTPNFSSPPITHARRPPLLHGDSFASTTDGSPPNLLGGKITLFTDHHPKHLQGSSIALPPNVLSSSRRSAYTSPTSPRNSIDASCIAAASSTGRAPHPTPSSYANYFVNQSIDSVGAPGIGQHPSGSIASTQNGASGGGLPVVKCAPLHHSPSTSLQPHANSPTSPHFFTQSENTLVGLSRAVGGRGGGGGDPNSLPSYFCFSTTCSFSTIVSTTSNTSNNNSTNRGILTTCKRQAMAPPHQSGGSSPSTPLPCVSPGLTQHNAPNGVSSPLPSPVFPTTSRLGGKVEEGDGPPLPSSAQLPFSVLEERVGGGGGDVWGPRVAALQPPHSGSAGNRTTTTNGGAYYSTNNTSAHSRFCQPPPPPPLLPHQECYWRCPRQRQPSPPLPPSCCCHSPFTRRHPHQAAPYPPSCTAGFLPPFIPPSRLYCAPPRVPLDVRAQAIREGADRLLRHMLGVAGALGVRPDHANKVCCQALQAMLAELREPPDPSDPSVKLRRAYESGEIPVDDYLGGPDFAAPKVLVHPAEFKNPSSFLKIYGDPLCSKGMGGRTPRREGDGNWTCASCRCINFPRRFRCNKCE